MSRLPVGTNNIMSESQIWIAKACYDWKGLVKLSENLSNLLMDV